MAERNVIRATRKELACINIIYASDFLSMLSKGDQLFFNNDDNEFFFYKDGAIYRTVRFKMDYELFCEHVKIGMDKWVLEGLSHPSLAYFYATEEEEEEDEEDDFCPYCDFKMESCICEEEEEEAEEEEEEEDKIPCISQYGKKQLKAAFDRNTAEIAAVSEHKPDLRNRHWLMSNDFTSKEQRSKVRDAGFWSPKEMQKAKEAGFSWGELYYFAKEFGFENEEEVLRALELETTDRELLIMTDEGGFDSIREAKEAQEMGFSDGPTFHKALELGCDNFEDYEAVTNGGWDDINELDRARGFGFEDGDSKLYQRLSNSDGTVVKRFFSRFYDSFYRGPPTKPELIVFCKEGGLALMEFSDEHDLKVWQSTIIMRINEIELGDMVLLSELERLAFECPSEIWGHSPDEAEVRSFIYEDERVHVYGTAIPADGIFERRTNSNGGNDFRKNDFNKSEEE